MNDTTQVIGPQSWGICLLRLWEEVDATEFADRLKFVTSGLEGASLIRVGPREWWMVSERPFSSDIVRKAVQTCSCAVDMSAAYIAITLKGGHVYRALARMGNAHDRDWLDAAKARRLRLADCSVVVLPRAAGELTLLVARSESRHILMAIQRSLSANALQ